MKNKLYIFLLVCFASCGEYEHLEIKKQLDKRVDSLFRTQRDSIRKLSESKCDSNYQIYYSTAVDSIKSVQLSKIENLFKK